MAIDTCCSLKLGEVCVLQQCSALRVNIVAVANDFMLPVPRTILLSLQAFMAVKIYTL